MIKIPKKISVALTVIFTFLIMGEVSGFRVHHATSVEIIHANHQEAIPGHDSGDRHSLPCENDETPIEHVIHHSAGYLADGNAFDDLFIPVILPSWYSFSLAPFKIQTSYACKHQVFKPLLIFETFSDRAPPATL